MSEGRIERQNNLVQSKNTMKKKEDFTCNVCSIIFTTKTDLKYHSLIHSGSFLYDACSEKPCTKLNLGEKCGINTAQKLYTCELCRKNYTGGQAFTDHRCVCAEEKQHPCDICAERFGSKALLKSHRRIHAERRHFICEICEKGFVREEVLNNNDACVQAHGNRRYLCRRCEKKCGSLPSLKARCLDIKEAKSKMIKDGVIKNPVEMRVRATDVIYVCEKCNKWFGDLNAFNQHQLVHSAVKPYVGEANKELNRENDQKLRFQERTNTKSFSFAECRERFAVYENLNRHVPNRTSFKPYARKTFRKSYSCKENMNQHTD